MKYTDGEEYSENNNSDEKKDKKLLIGFALMLVFIVLFSVFLFSPKKDKTQVKVVKSDKKTERPASKNNFAALKVPPKIPVLNPGQKFHFTIQRDIYFNGDMTNINLKINLPQDVPNRQKVANVTITPQPQKIETKDGEKYAIIHFSSAPEKIIVSISGDAVVRTYNLENALKVNKNIDGALSEEDKQYYLRADKGLDVDNSYMIRVANGIETATNDVDTVKNIFDFVVNHMRYNKNEVNVDKGSLLAMQSGTGVCEEFSNLFVTLCRIKGIPARVITGFDIPFTDEENLLELGHAWAEVYFPQYGWVVFDPTNKLGSAIRKKSEELGISPYDLISGLIKYRTYLTVPAKEVSVRYDGRGSVVSKNLRIEYKRI